VLEVEEWAEIRRLHFVGGVSVRELARRTGRGRNTIRRALRSDDAPRYVRGPGPSILDPFKDVIRRLVRDDPRLPGVRVHELIGEQGYGGGKTLVYGLRSAAQTLPDGSIFKRNKRVQFRADLTRPAEAPGCSTQCIRCIGTASADGSPADRREIETRRCRNRVDAWFMLPRAERGRLQ
jgi:transposase